MRILVVTQYFWPENFRINDLVQALRTRGHELTVLTGEPNYPEGVWFDFYLADKEKFASFHGTQVVRVPMTARGVGRLRLLLNYLSFAVSASLLGPWMLRGQRFDVILAYEPSPITVGIPAAAMRWLKKAPMAFWVLDLWPETLQAIGVLKPGLVFDFVGSLVKFIYARCDVILAQSTSFIGKIRQYAKPHTPVEYFPNWAESVFDGEAIEVAPEVMPMVNCFTILFAGNIGEAQDFPAILDAVQQLAAHQDIRWVVLGDGRMRAWVADEIERRGLRHCIELMGSYPVERMPSFYAHADALLLSLKDEPIFGMTIPGKLQSYLASGVPVLGMLNGEGAQIITNFQVGLAVPAGDSGALVAAVMNLKGLSPVQRDEMGRRGRALYEEQYARNKLIDRAEALLKGLCEQHKN